MDSLIRLDYPSLADEQIRHVARRAAEGVEESLLVYPSRFGGRRAAALLRPTISAAAHPVLLYVHWYDSESPESRRTQFEGEARAMVQRGAIALLIETMWSDRDWFYKRTQAEDYDNSIKQLVELRQAMDLLLAQPGADASRFGYVGHDFGAMYGTLMGSVDPRPTCYALLAPTPRFADWYLYGSPLAPEARDAFLGQMAPLDPIARVAALAPAPLLFQFGTDDPHIPPERAQALFDAARAPKQLHWYPAGHELDAAATRDRIGWLVEQLGL